MSHTSYTSRSDQLNGYNVTVTPHAHQQSTLAGRAIGSFFACCYPHRSTLYINIFNWKLARSTSPDTRAKRTELLRVMRVETKHCTTTTSWNYRFLTYLHRIARRLTRGRASPVKAEIVCFRVELDRTRAYQQTSKRKGQRTWWYNIILLVFALTNEYPFWVLVNYITFFVTSHF